MDSGKKVLKILPWIMLIIGVLLYNFLGRDGPNEFRNELIQLAGSVCMLISIFMFWKQRREKQGRK
jgi:hypothetical protein